MPTSRANLGATLPTRPKEGGAWFEVMPSRPSKAAALQTSGSSTAADQAPKPKSAAQKASTAADPAPQPKTAAQKAAAASMAAGALAGQPAGHRAAEPKPKKAPPSLPKTVQVAEQPPKAKPAADQQPAPWQLWWWCLRDDPEFLALFPTRHIPAPHMRTEAQVRQCSITRHR